MKRAVVFVLALVLGLSPAIFAGEKIVIGHRGAAGYLPEHTLESYAFAYALGADYIEPDLVMTKDGVLICLHDIYLEFTTNVENIFPERRRSDGHWYAIDFTLEEIKRLSVHERCRRNGRPYFPDRFPVGKSHFEIPTFAEMIELIQGLNRSTGRDVGIYPELKKPSWHMQRGYDIAAALMEILDRYGYRGPDAKVFIQCFEADTLKRLREEFHTELPLIQLVSASPTYWHMWTKEGLAEIARYADGIGPNKSIIEDNPDYVVWAHEFGLLVHPYTFRADSLPRKYGSLEEELETFFFTYGVDGVFTDHPDVAVKLFRGTQHVP
ncbi:glycerophosphodiester phosphodiesterase [Candidatus Acetothermia bacterium]|nr:MAG: glycerophosphodiester phosphodiesterase [Candidatus Acetothermia bacterium]